MRRLRLVLLALGALALVAGTGAMSSTTADRGVSVQVADDEDALLGIETEGVVVSAPPADRGGDSDSNDGGENGNADDAPGNSGDAPGRNASNASDASGADRTTLLTLTNNAPGALDVSVDVAGGGDDEPTVQGLQAPDTLDAGERVPVEGTVVCGGERGEYDLTVDIVAAGDGLEIDATRELTVECGS
ncbi:hypothetical protein [Halomarina ordinaria]|uniref:DUF1102 domain-containing protein n=1 Tax=Halomarina ordinaria TaxID=3033939 RepID=A0ABD5U664_9EURY|nr:hypothetical protein [Halomarina sp. PSRA2]